MVTLRTAGIVSGTLLQRGAITISTAMALSYLLLSIFWNVATAAAMGVKIVLMITKPFLNQNVQGYWSKEKKMEPMNN